MNLKIKEIVKKILTLFVSGQQDFYNDSGMVRKQKCIVKIKIPDTFQGFFIKPQSF